METSESQPSEKIESLAFYNFYRIMQLESCEND